MVELVSTARNPIPTGAQVAMLSSFDGTQLRVARWRAAAGGRNGTVCVFGGRCEFIEKYFETIADLRRRGFAVAAMDWRGQGGSERKLRNHFKGHVEDFSEFDSDLDVFMSEFVLPDCPPPYFALAHSMGGNILLRAACRRDCWFERMVLSAPMVRLAKAGTSTSAVAVASEVLVFCGLGELFVPGGHAQGWETEPFEGNPLTSDEQRYSRNREILLAEPLLALGSPTIGWVRAAFDSMKTLNDLEFASRVHVPLLMLAAGSDTIVSSTAIEELAAQLKAGSHIPLAASCHEIFQETDWIREQAWAAFDAFVPGSG